MTPKARKHNLDITRSGDSLQITDKNTKKEIRLGRVMTMFWEMCDGTNSPWKIGKLMLSVHGLKFDEDAVWHALKELKEKNLLIDDGDDSLDRYEFVHLDPALQEFKSDWN